MLLTGSPLFFNEKLQKRNKVQRDKGNFFSCCAQDDNRQFETNVFSRDSHGFGMKPVSRPRNSNRSDDSSYYKLTPIKMQQDSTAFWTPKTIEKYDSPSPYGK